MEFDIYRVKLTAPAETDLSEIIDYILKELEAPLAAENMMDAAEEVFRKLEFSPQSYSKVPDDRLSAIGYRWIGIKNYMAFFRIDESQKLVIVDRILYGRRNWQHIL